MRTPDELMFISTAARLLGMHPQTLRKYERLGLVRPTRAVGSMRVYSADEIARLRLIKRFVDDDGVNLAGVQRLLGVADAAERMRSVMRDASVGRIDTRRRLAQELEALCDLLGL